MQFAVVVASNFARKVNESEEILFIGKVQKFFYKWFLKDLTKVLTILKKLDKSHSSGATAKRI